jgi:hypothetical protein
MQVYTRITTLADDHPELADIINKHLSASDLIEDFMWSLGGDVHVVETQEEYDHLISTEAFFDIAEEVGYEWFQFVVINNNAGGPTWFVPNAFLKE